MLLEDHSFKLIHHLECLDLEFSLLITAEQTSDSHIPSRDQVRMLWCFSGDVTPPEDSVHAGHSSGDVVSLSIEETK